MVKYLIFKIMKQVYFVFFFLLVPRMFLQAQEKEDFAAGIKTIKFYKVGDQASFPIIGLNSAESLELDFDDLDNSYKNYYYSFQLCNADWTPGLLHSYEYIRGFQSVHITTYRNSSIALYHYLHYQALVPDKNCTPALSGNYLLKVFLDNDTNKLVFTRRFVVVENQSLIAGQILQPYSPNLFQTAQKLQITVQTDSRVQIMNPSDIKVAVLQNKNWQSASYLDKPTIYRGNYLEYSDEMLTSFGGAKEFRWIDLRSLRLMSDRMLKMTSHRDTTDVYIKPEGSRVNLPYLYYQDLNGSYLVSALEDINPFWQGDYAQVHFSYIPADHRPFRDMDLYIFGEMTNYGSDETGKMEYNAEKGQYEKILTLKQGFYNYLYALMPSAGAGFPDFSQTEGNFYGTENSYTILAYYRPFGARADKCIGYASINSIFQRNGGL